MKNKEKSISAYELKYLALLLFTWLCFSTGAQNKTGKDHHLQVLDPVWLKDTSAFGATFRNLSFTINMQEISQLRALSIKFLNKDNSVVADLGTYELKNHPKGFCYLENAVGDKKTIFDSNIHFSNKIGTDNASQVKKIKVNYRVGNSDEASLIVSVLD